MPHLLPDWLTKPNAQAPVEEAKVEEKKKKTFVVFTASWCGPCRSLHDSLASPNVIKRLQGYATYTVDIDQDKVSRERYKVSAVPAIFVLDENNVIIKQDTGSKSAQQLLSWIP